MSEQITLAEVLKLVTFEKVDDEWGVQKVMGNVWGDVYGSVRGDIGCDVRGSVCGDVLGDVRGKVLGRVDLRSGRGRVRWSRSVGEDVK